MVPVNDPARCVWTQLPVPTAVRSPPLPTQSQSTPLLELRGVEKSFGGVRALKPLSLEVHPDDVIGLIGENGAGKSTLIKLLSGVLKPDRGEIRWNGTPISFASPHEALALGIGTIHQELAYCGPLTVAENLFLGEPWPRRAWGAVDWPALHRAARERLDRFEIPVDTTLPFQQLSSAQKQEVAIARALSRQARLLILDEPTASLTEPEVRRLFSHLQRLRAAGVALIYVSHRLDEILSLTNRVVVLRDGEQVAGYPTGEADAQRLVRDMVGRTVTEHQRAARTGELAGVSAEVLVELDRATHHGLFENVSLRLHAGEILGLAGLVGAGRSELARALFGLYPLTAGSMTFAGQPWKPGSPSEALRAGIAYLPEERKRQGLVLDHSVGDSISLGFSDLLARWGWIPESAERPRVAEAIARFRVKTPGPAQAIGTLSGGNQQKAMLARWLERDPAVIILDEPTRGVDVGAKAEIHELITQLADRGKGVLLISSDLPEVLGLSDRVLVLHDGRITAELRGPDKTEEKALLAASGLT